MASKAAISPDHLPARSLRIDHSATVVRAYKAVKTHEPKVGIDANVEENRGECCCPTRV